MVDFGVTKLGFKRKLFNDCLEERILRAREVFGVNIDTSETSFLGQLIRNTAWDESVLWEELEAVYLSPFVNTAEGITLDAVGQYLTITRRPASKAKGIITVKGNKGLTVGKGFKVATATGVIYETTEDALIGADGAVKVEVISVGAGRAFNVGAEALTEIVNPTFGIDGVVNEKATEGGLDVETDAEFRERYKKSYSRVGGSTVQALTAALLDTKKVVDCEVKENVTMSTTDGIPPKSIACYVFGGEDKDIAQAIFENKAAGIQAFGSTIVRVKDSKGREHEIGFTRAAVQDVWVRLKVTRAVDYKGDEAVKRAILNYIGGQDLDGVLYTGLKLGGDVIYTKVIGRVMCLGGCEDAEVELSRNGSEFVKSNLDVAKNVIARTSPERISISYV